MFAAEVFTAVARRTQMTREPTGRQGTKITQITQIRSKANAFFKSA